MNNTGFLKLMKTPKTLELMKNADAFLLATIIAWRARRTDDFNVLNLKSGQALLGDYKNYGLTMQRYRTAKKNLQNWQIATFKTANKGTIATLCDQSIYDINAKPSDNQIDNRATTNKKDKNQLSPFSFLSINFGILRKIFIWT
jgi:hypothetical protein